MLQTGLQEEPPILDHSPCMASKSTWYKNKGINITIAKKLPYVRIEYVPSFHLLFCLWGYIQIVLLAGGGEVNHHYDWCHHTQEDFKEHNQSE